MNKLVRFISSNEFEHFSSQADREEKARLKILTLNMSTRMEQQENEQGALNIRFHVQEEYRFICLCLYRRNDK